MKLEKNNPYILTTALIQYVNTGCSNWKAEHCIGISHFLDFFNYSRTLNHRTVNQQLIVLASAVQKVYKKQIYIASVYFSH